MLALLCLLLIQSISYDARGTRNAERGTITTDSVVIEEWEVPWASTRPRDPYVGPDGAVWFVGQRGDYAARFDPETASFERFDLPAGSGPHNLIVDSLGTVWYAGNRQSHIGAMDPSDGSIRQIPMPDPDARDPHTLVFGQEGDIWFTVQGGNFVGRLDVETSEVALVRPPTSNSRPYGIVVNSKGEPWVALFGTNKLARVDPTTKEITEVVLPRSGARPRRLQVTSDDRVWYVDYPGGYLGVHDPASGSFDEWRMPSGSNARPYGMAVDAADRLWFVETGPTPNRFVGFDPETESFLPATSIPSGGGSVRHMYYDAEANTVWFGTDANTIGRARLPQAAVTIERDQIPDAFSVSSPYPNPAANRAQFVVTSEEPGSVALTVFDVAGRVVLRSGGHSLPDSRTISFDVSGLVSGWYLVRVRLRDQPIMRALLVAD